MVPRSERGITKPGEPKRRPAAGLVCGKEAGPDWCEAAVFARGLCRPHYRRAARRLPIDPDDGKQVGVTVSGHGLWGVLTEEQGRLLCHECGRWYTALGVHVAMTHEMDARQYRLTHGLLMNRGLVAGTLHDRLSRASRPSTIAAHSLLQAALEMADPDTQDRGHRLRRAQGGH